MDLDVRRQLLKNKKFDGNYVLFCFQCLLFVLGCKDSEDLSLTGHHLESLAELAINKFAAVSMGDKKTEHIFITDSLHRL